MIYFKLYQVGCFLTIIECCLTKFFKYVSIETLNRGGNIMIDGNKKVEGLSIPQLDKLLKTELTMAQRDYVRRPRLQRWQDGQFGHFGKNVYYIVCTLRKSLCCAFPYSLRC